MLSPIAFSPPSDGCFWNGDMGLLDSLNSMGSLDLLPSGYNVAADDFIARAMRLPADTALETFRDTSRVVTKRQDIRSLIRCMMLHRHSLWALNQSITTNQSITASDSSLHFLPQHTPSESKGCATSAATSASSGQADAVATSSNTSFNIAEYVTQQRSLLDNVLSSGANLQLIVGQLGMSWTTYSTLRLVDCDAIRTASRASLSQTSFVADPVGMANTNDCTDSPSTTSTAHDDVMFHETVGEASRWNFNNAAQQLAHQELAYHPVVQWYWVDDNQQLVPYAQSQDIERAYILWEASISAATDRSLANSIVTRSLTTNSHSGNFVFHVDSVQYLIDFATSKQHRVVPVTDARPRTVVRKARMVLEPLVPFPSHWVYAPHVTLNFVPEQNSASSTSNGVMTKTSISVCFPSKRQKKEANDPCTVSEAKDDDGDDDDDGISRAEDVESPTTCTPCVLERPRGIPMTWFNGLAKIVRLKVDDDFYITVTRAFLSSMHIRIVSSSSNKSTVGVPFMAPAASTQVAAIAAAATSATSAASAASATSATSAASAASATSAASAASATSATSAVASASMSVASSATLGSSLRMRSKRSRDNTQMTAAQLPQPTSSLVMPILPLISPSSALPPVMASKSHCFVPGYENVRVTAFYQVQNASLWMAYEMRRRTMQQEVDPLGNYNVEKTMLFHGTSWSSIKSAVHQGLNANLSSGPIVGRLYGNGIYLTPTSSFATHYALRRTTLTERKAAVLVCRALVGRSEKGSPQQQGPNSVPDAQRYSYHSTVDNLSKPRQYCVWNANQVYIDAIIEFTFDVIPEDRTSART